MYAVIDLTKGRYRNGKPTVHFNPDLCPIAATAAPTTGVTAETALRGMLIGQWWDCPHCVPPTTTTRRT